VTRALLLAGGGAKIGWASGALQVLLEEGDRAFDHIDATSGSMFNLAMLLSGRSPAFVAEAWGELSPRELISYHPWWRYPAFWRLPSVLTQDAARDHIVPKWGIDVATIRACTELGGHPVVGTFNVCDFDEKRIVSIPHHEIEDIDTLLAVDAVPGIVPPVRRHGTLYVDAMLLMTANVGEALRRGADEIWIIWTVEDRGVWKGGLWNHLGHVFEICGVGNLKRDLDTVDAMNARVASGRTLEGDRHVTVHVLQPEEPVPVDYLFFRNRQQMRPVIETGRRVARRYLQGLAAG
jgi:predicted patatin/cPLA2 family phospholipase